MSNLTPEQLEQIENAWLSCPVQDKYIINPIKDIPEAFKEEPHIFLTYMLTRPEYIATFAKYVMNMTLLPYQNLFLRAMWEKKFPILIGSRGCSKSFSLAIYALLRMIFLPNRKVVVAGSGFRQSKIIFEYMENMWNNAPLLRDMFKGESKIGPFHDVDMWRFYLNGGHCSALPVGCLRGNMLITTRNGIKRIQDLNNSRREIYGTGGFKISDLFFKNGVKRTVRLKTEMGYEFIATPDHKIKVYNEDILVWKRIDEIVAGDIIPIDYSVRLNIPYGINKNAYNNGSNLLKTDIYNYSLFELKSYIKGVFENKGCFTSNYKGRKLIFKSEDTELVDFIHFGLLNIGVVSEKRNGIIIHDVDTYIKNIGYHSDGNAKPERRLYKDNVISIEDYEECETYDVHIPLDNEYCAGGFLCHNSGEKIRGQRAHDLIVDETKSLNPQIFEEVMSGFLAVSSDPIGNVIREAARQKAAEFGVEMEDEERIKSNQIIMSGTAYYAFNHFCKYWEKWKNIIHAKNDPSKLKFAVGEENVMTSLNSDDYLVIRMPYELLPARFMDEAQVSRTKASITSGIYANEFGSVFSTDSNGFFKRTLIDSCVCHDGFVDKRGNEVYFEPRLVGDRRYRYIMGIDPASERDNLCITIVELHEVGRRLVYCWTTTRKQHREALSRGIIKENDYFSFVNRKVRDLMSRFNIERIMIDAQGGGYAVMEAFKNTANLKQHEKPIFLIKDPKVDNPDDMLDGHHIVEAIQFVNNKWLSEANYGMKKDLEEQELLFPNYDAVSLSIAIEQDSFDFKNYDTLQDCMEEIEALKDELCSITLTITPTGREQFSTPEEIVDGKKSKQKKDRYSSLLMSNMGARQLQNDTSVEYIPTMGGFAGGSGRTTENMYSGNAAFAKAAQDAYASY